MTHSTYKILVVEDAKIAQRMAYIILNDMGHAVQIANTGAEAISNCKDQSFDIIFMDLGLPDIDGFSTTEAIRKIESEQTTPIKAIIIALTSHEGEHVEITCIDSKMDDFLVKPLTEEKVNFILKKHLHLSSDIA